MLRQFTDSDDMSWLQQEDLEVGAEVFFDPEVDFSDPEIYSLSTDAWSNDGNYWAYTYVTSGADWETIRIRDL